MISSLFPEIQQMLAYNGEFWSRDMKQSRNKKYWESSDKK
jgi:hypothetical protein